MSAPHDHEARRIARALHEGRALAAALGVPHESVLAARALAQWAEAIGENSLALAAWEGCVALDDACASWLGLAETCLAASRLDRAWDAAARVSIQPDASLDERARAHLVLGRVCLAIGRLDEARQHLERVPGETAPHGRRLASALASSLRRA